MPEKQFYNAFTLESPWSGLFHFFIEGGTHYRQAMDASARLTQSEPIRAISKRAYDTAWKIACLADGTDQ